MYYNLNEAATICKCTVAELHKRLLDGDTSKIESVMYVTRLALQRLMPNVELPDPAGSVAEFVPLHKRLEQIEAQMKRLEECLPKATPEAAPAKATMAKKEPDTRDGKKLG